MFLSTTQISMSVLRTLMDVVRSVPTGRDVSCAPVIMALSLPLMVEAAMVSGSFNSHAQTAQHSCSH